MNPNRLAAHAALQTLYTLHGVDNPLITPAMRRQVEHRSGQLSRRGFLGIVGAGSAGVMAGAVFDPVVKLWTPTQGPAIELAPAAGVFRVDGALQELARLLALAFDRNAGSVIGVYRPSGWRGRGRNLETVQDLGRGWTMAHARNILHSAEGDATDWLVTPEGHSQLDYMARRWGLEVPAFNERHPLMPSAVETDPSVRVADHLSPERGCLVRVIQYEQAPGGMGTPKTWTDFELVGVYRPVGSKG